MGVLDAIGGIFGKVGEAADKVFTSDEERLAFELELAKLKASAMESLHGVMVAETKSESWLTRTWRPITGLAFVGLLLFIFGKAALTNTPPIAVPVELLHMIAAILGVGILGRSYEKGKK